jgi:tetratricopeptide (TPR) repeat protein
MEDLSTVINALNAGNLVQAETICRNIINKNPQHAEALHLMGIIQLQSGKLHDAEASLRTALQIKPDEAPAYSSLGNVLTRLGKFEEAVECHKHAVSLIPSSAKARSNLASAYLSWNKIDLAIEEYRNAVNMEPNSAELHFNLGTALQKGEKYEDACVSFRSALKLNPDHERANMNLGTSLRSLGFLDEAILYLRRATGLAPDYADAQWNLSLALLMSGDYINGWKAYEWRLKIPDITIRKFPQPFWDGSDRPDNTLLIYAEQGIGDAIQFIRYAATARKKVGRVILYCHAPLVKLFSEVNGVDQVVSAVAQLPGFDFQLPLLSLPGVIGITADKITDKVPYLKADMGLINKWRSKIIPEKYKVGLVWAGNPKHLDDHNRSCKLSAFASLMKMPEAVFYSLQKGNSDTQTINRAESTNLIDTGIELTDFADTAALIANMDLVISVDTAVAHLAGAMGHQVWTLLPFAPDWRWMLDREDTPWYPTMRLFRQSRFGDWDGVLANVEQALKAYIRS